MRITARRFLPVALIAAFVSACADAPTSTAVGLSPNLPSMHVVPVAAPTFELLILCKAGPVGTYTFNATATHPVLRNATTGVIGETAATYTINVTVGSTIDVGGSPVPGACFDFSGHNYIAIAGGTIAATVTVTESGIPSGIDFDHVVTYQNTSGSVSSSSSTTNSASGQIGGIGGVAAYGASILFYNVNEPPPPSGCTYTKGWYRNNGSGTVVAVDGRTIAQAQAIFNATPGKPGTVTWQGDNNTLNLYQQLLAALLNRGTAVTTGITAVDQAITDAQTATGGTGTNITLVAGTDVSGLIDTLSAFNEGTYTGWPHCAD